MTRDANDPVFVILTSKPGVYRTEADALAEIVETYDYACDGRLRAVFSIARLRGPSRLVVTEETSPYVVNRVPSKFLEAFASLEAARQELVHLTRFGSIDTTLTRHPDRVAAEQ